MKESKTGTRLQEKKLKITRLLIKLHKYENQMRYFNFILYIILFYICNFILYFREVSIKL